MDSLHVTPLDGAIVAAHFLLTIGLGVWFGRRRVATAESLFLANREATWPVIGASMFSANISSQQFVGQAGLAYMIGLAAGAFQLVGAVAFTLLGVFFVDIYLGLKLRTAPEFFERRYNAGSRMFVSAINIVIIIAANISAALYSGGTVMTSLLGWTEPREFILAVAVIAAAAGTYTIFGGLRSVMWTDLLQVSLLVLGGAITFFLSLSYAGGIGAVLPTYDATGHNLWSVLQPWDHAFGWLPLATGSLVLAIHGHCTDHDYVQRALAARNVFHAKMGAVFAAFLKVIALFIIAAPGVIAAKVIPGLAHPDEAYIRLIALCVPPGLAGLLLAGLLAAILGSVAAGLAAASSLLSYDFVLRFAPELSERARVRLGRWLMAGILLLCAFLAPGIRQHQGVYDYCIRILSLLAPSVFVCVIAGILTRRATRRGAVATLAIGTTLGAAAFGVLSSPELTTLLPRYLRSSLNFGFVLTLVCAIVMIVFSIRADPSAAGAVDQFHAAIARKATTRRERRVFRIVVVVLAVIWLGVVLTFSPWGIAQPRI